MNKITQTPWAEPLGESVRTNQRPWADAYIICNRDAVWLEAQHQAVNWLNSHPEWLDIRIWSNDFADRVTQEDRRHLAWFVLRNAVLALSIWPKQEHLLTTPPEQVYLQSLLGNHAATLLYGASLALEPTYNLDAK